MSISTPYVLLGAGGHAAVVLDALEASGAPLPAMALDSDPALHGQHLFQIPIEGGDEVIPLLAARGILGFVMGLGSAGSTHARRALFQLATLHRLHPVALLHPAASVSPRARIGAGVQVMARAVVGVRASLADNVLVNTGAIVEHDCQIGEHAHLASGCVLAGSVTVERGAHIGAGAVVRQGARIGQSAIVGAGAVVVQDVPSRAIVTGVPARLLRWLEDGN